MAKPLHGITFIHSPPILYRTAAIKTYSVPFCRSVMQSPYLRIKIPLSTHGQRAKKRGTTSGSSVPRGTDLGECIHSNAVTGVPVLPYLMLFRGQLQGVFTTALSPPCTNRRLSLQRYLCYYSLSLSFILSIILYQQTFVKVK